ncbi:peritrophin-1 [Dendroctonus ponderosae]|uniref:Chitin-binding type-2 domain-containing protein n=1 Tax=Dendroctonus ponderosae TaxID=77166 RepID=U4UNM3_DENPD|nr:peritrophin-1 [Dendroctonus ponderosae]ERL91746.1 hypothetical protein D910_09072 [Dendroctonus ponderosae]
MMMTMKIFCVLAFVATSAFAWKEPAQANGGWKEPSRPAIGRYSSVDCSIPANQVILHPHPTSCTKYLQCNHGSPLERPCAPGTEFSPSIGVCVHPWQSDCTAGQEVEEEDVVEVPEDSVEDVTEADDVEDATELPEALEAPLLKPIGGRERRAFSLCAQNPSRVFIAADPTDCASYVICAVGFPVLKSCARGQHFEGASLQCEAGACQS